MIFLDTCIWIELLSVRTPTKPHEIQQAIAASKLLNSMLEQNETIVTCKEQLIEMISAIEKVTMRTVNKARKNNNMQGIGSLKEFRAQTEFTETKRLCKSVLDDLCHFAVINSLGDYNINSVLEKLELADINDCLYYDYCVRERIDFYTFDIDLEKLGNDDILHKYDKKIDAWN